MGWNNISRTLLMTGVAAIGLVCANPALAQEQPTPPEHYTLDERGVDLVHGTFNYYEADVVIGQPGNGGIIHGRMHANNGWRDTLSGSIRASGTLYTVSMGAESELFIRSGSTFTPASTNGSTLTLSGSTYTFTTSDGAVGEYAAIPSNSTTPYAASVAIISSHRQPNGEELEYHWEIIDYCAVRDLQTEQCLEWRVGYRLKSVTNNRGYMIKYGFVTDIQPDGGQFRTWFYRNEAIGINLTEEYCDPDADSCSLTGDWPSVEYDLDSFGRVDAVTDQSGRTTSYSYIGETISGIQEPGSGSPDINIGYVPTTFQVQSIGVVGSTWNYAYNDSGSTRTITTTNPGSPATTTEAVSNQTTGRMTSFENELGDVTSYQYDSQHRLERATHPEGNYTEYDYGSRGNVTTVTHVPKSGSGLANIVVSAAYPSSCSNPLICNQPTSITDARGATTDFTYDPDHGGILAVTAPAPTTGADRPQTRFSYEETYAWYKDASGNVVQAPTPVILPSEIRACAVGETCENTAAETVTTVSYGPGGTTNPSNLLPSAVTQRSGDSSISTTTSFSYTANGDIASVDGPLSGSADTTHYRYNDARQLEGVIGPDADGAGPDPRRAMMNVYYSSGRLGRTHYGTVAGLTEPDWAAFTTLQRQATIYDSYGRPVEQREQAAGGTTRALTQVSYDARGRVECTAFRMNTAVYASLPSSACDLTTAGDFGPDRVARYVYDAASQVTATTSGYAVDPITQQFTWTDNGQLQTARDGDGNLSTWEYDGFDRVLRLLFPTLNGSTSNPDDYMGYGYDANSNVVMVRPRGNRDPADPVFTTTYDALNRPIQLDAPASVPDVTYAYDNLGRITGASQPGHAMTWSWDALGRLTSQTDPFGTYGFQYDAAGRRTRITWPDDFYAQYDWSLYNQMTAVRENGATSGAGVLAEYAYDDLGRRTGITRGNGVTTTYEYGELSRLTSIAHDLAGGGDDVTFTMAHNTAGQVISRTISNDAYAYQPANDDINYVINGRNEITSSDGQTFDYDADRNLTYDGVRAYTYDAANRMLSVGSSGFSYDPAGNLYQAGNALLMSMVGGERLAIHTASDGHLYRRIIPGPGLDEYAGYYHGASTSSSARRWPLADHQGSVVAYADSSAEAAVINTYDEYGRGGPNNAERLQYTGQFTLNAALDLLNYRNRFYNPRIGRFMQTDPILYGDGLNLYKYVGNDPVNRIDPWGLQYINVACGSRTWMEGEEQVIEVILCEVWWNPAGESFPGFGFDQMGLNGDPYREPAQPQSCADAQYQLHQAQTALDNLNTMREVVDQPEAGVVAALVGGAILLADGSSTSLPWLNRAVTTSSGALRKAGRFAGGVATLAVVSTQTAVYVEDRFNDREGDVERATATAGAMCSS